jgi:flagellar hook-associated protein 2
MSTPLSSIQGLASAVQWQDLVTTIIAQEKARMLDPVTNAITAAKSGVTAWTSFQALVKTFSDSAVALREGAIGSVAATGGTTASGRALLSATTTNGAVPGSFEAQVLSLAHSAKVAGATVSSSTTALGLSGEFFVNGTRVVVIATDTLAKIRDRINAVNVGSGSTGVTATVNAASGGSRLVLNASATGASGIQLTDGTSGVLQQLGLVDGSTASSSAQPQSYRFSSSTTAIGTLLGTTDLPAATTITVGNATIAVDLSVDTLADIQARIASAGVGARLSTQSFNGTTWQRIDVDEAVGATPGDADSARVLSLLGFTQPGQSSVTQVLADLSAWTDAGGSAATSATTLASLRVGGTALGLVAGDSIQISGVRGDGMPVTATLALDGSETVATLLAKLNDSSVFGAVSRSATATLAADGTLLLTDGTAGGSQLSLSLSVKRADGGTASFGRVATQTTGYDRVLVQGSDARFSIDGELFTRSSNTISDVIPNVTLNLSAAEAGTTVDLTLARDVAGASTAVQNLATAYNAIVDFVKTQTASGGALAFSSTLRSALREISNILRQDVPGLSGTLTRGALVGLAMDKTGHLQLDQATFAAALQNRPYDVLALFGKASVVQANGTIVQSTGLGGALAALADSMTRSGDGLAAEHIAVLETRTNFLSARADDIQARLDRHHDTLTARFVAMETALSRLQAQSATLTSQINSLQSSGK